MVSPSSQQQSNNTSVEVTKPVRRKERSLSYPLAHPNSNAFPAVVVAGIESRSEDLSECSHDGSASSRGRLHVPTGSSASCIRSRFLNRLGIMDSKQREQHPGRGAMIRRNSHHGETTSVDPGFVETLKADYGRPDQSLQAVMMSSAPSSVSLSSSASSSVISSRSNSFGGPDDSTTIKAVTFDRAVRVHPIPRHSAFSSRIRKTLWTSPEEMQQSAARNCLEFAAENWDWRQVAEDKDMVVYNGERIHPIHFAQEFNARKQFYATLSAQQQEQQQTS